MKYLVCADPIFFGFIF